MSQVADILNAKTKRVIHSIAPEGTMLEALQRMSEQGIGALLVLDADQQIAGIVTERDYARKIALQGRSSSATPVSEVMTAVVHCVGPQQSSQECMSLMTQHRIRHLPVVDAQHRPLGMVSIGDLVKDIISSQQFTIAQLEHYISGSP